MYRMSTTNDLVIRMGCGNGDTVGCKWGNGKGLREGWGLEKVLEICRRVKNRTLKTEGYGTRTRPSGACLCHPPLTGLGDDLGVMESGGPPKPCSHLPQERFHLFQTEISIISICKGGLIPCRILPIGHCESY